MRLGDVVDQLHDEDGLADSGAAKETDLTTLWVGGDQVDDLDASLENLGRTNSVGKGGGLGVDGGEVLGLDGSTLVNGLANDVDDAAKGGWADGDLEVALDDWFKNSKKD